MGLDFMVGPDVANWTQSASAAEEPVEATAGREQVARPAGLEPATSWFVGKGRALDSRVFVLVARTRSCSCGVFGSKLFAIVHAVLGLREAENSSALSTMATTWWRPDADS